jgi:hypothetical protein
MLRASALQYGRSWDQSLPYVEFSYNNSYQESLKMVPFEMLYGRMCRTPIFWNEIEDRHVFELDIVQDTEKQVRIVRENLNVAQSHHKSYAYRRWSELSFEVWDFENLKLSPMRGIRWFEVRGKLASRFIGPFKILERKAEVAYEMELPAQLSVVYDMFHVSQLKKCLWMPKKQVPLEDIVTRDVTP